MGPPKLKKRARPWYMNAVPGPYSDHVYKSEHGVDIPLRVWPATSGKGPRPYLVWYHGGGFTYAFRLILC